MFRDATKTNSGNIGCGHTPVLLKEVIEVLDPKPGEFFIDGTIDGGGHAFEIIKRIKPNGVFLGTDWDETMVESINSKLKTKNYKLKTILINANYADMTDILKINKLGKADGLLLDLGFSSEQLESAGRGFSYLKDEPLIMAYSKSQIAKGVTAAKAVNSLPEKKLAEIIIEYGEERYSRRIAKKIADIRKKSELRTTFDLVKAVKSAVPAGYERGRLHPAARTFQALRIYVNQELENLKKALADLPLILKQGGRAAVVSFHSLEDRIVKNAFREMHKGKVADIITRKPIRPTMEEITKNPRSKSAKLRACQII